MKEKPSLKSTKLHQQHNGEVPPISFSKLLDPEASWDKEYVVESRNENEEPPELDSVHITELRMLGLY